MSSNESTSNTGQQAGTVQCPYCAEDIKSQAIVCKHCGRDLYFFGRIMQRLAALEASIHIGDATTSGRLTQRLERVEDALAQIAQRPPGAPLDLPPPPVADTGSGRWWQSAAMLFACVFSLVAAFTLLNLVFDLKEIYLRVASIVIPALFGFLHVARRRFNFAREALIGLLITGAFLAVMTYILARLQDLPWAPQDMREWREVITFGSSILFAYFTGGMLAKIVAERTGARRPGQLALETARLVATFSSSAGARGEQIKSLADSLQTFASNCVIVGTSVAAIWTGIGKLFF